MDEVSRKLYKLGQVFTKITDNLDTIEKYCEKNLRESHNLSGLFVELKRSVYASCSQVKKPASVYTNILIPLCKKSVTDFDNIYDMLKLRSEMVKAYPVATVKGSYPSENKFSVNSTSGSVSKDSEDAKKAIRLANLNYKIFKEYVGMYGVSGNETLEIMQKFARSMNEGSNIDKKIWLNFISFLRQSETMLSTKKELNQAL